MRTLQRLSIENFKSIRKQALDLGVLNVFIGGNGAGKSNLVEVFKFLRAIVNQELQTYVAKKGGADSFLHYGRKHSASMEFFLEFGEGTKSNGYKIKLIGTNEDSLIIEREQALYHEKTNYKKPYDIYTSLGTKESELRRQSHMCAQQVSSDLDSYRVYHFHDTSDTAAVKGTAEVEDNRFLRPQAENLAAFLYWLQQKQPDHFSLIEDTIQQIAPFFGGFRLEPRRLNEDQIRLEWNERGSDAYFGATSLSDGTLRFICLATLLLQPQLPKVVLLDEPELGLHPAAITLLANLLSSASTRTQVLVATQSVTLVNNFRPEEVWAVDRRDNASEFRRLSGGDMSQWLDDYALGELWEKNLLGARP